MTTDRTITLTAEQARRVLVGIGTTNDDLRVLALNVMAFALTAADEPVPAVAAEPAPAPMSSARAELHALAPLPWTVDSDGDVWDARGRYQFFPQGGAASNRARRAELVARIVNEPESATPPVAVALRALAVDEVLAAARYYAALAGSTPPPAEQLCRAVRALDALDGSGGAA